jgi:hypothetical protein
MSLNGLMFSSIPAPRVVAFFCTATAFYTYAGLTASIALK